MHIEKPVGRSQKMCVVIFECLFRGTDTDAFKKASLLCLLINYQYVACFFFNSVLIGQFFFSNTIFLYFTGWRSEKVKKEREHRSETRGWRTWLAICKSSLKTLSSLLCLKIINKTILNKPWLKLQMIFMISEPKFLEGQKKKTKWRSTSKSGWSQGFGIRRRRFQSETKNVRNFIVFGHV